MQLERKQTNVKFILIKCIKMFMFVLLLCFPAVNYMMLRNFESRSLGISYFFCTDDMSLVIGLHGVISLFFNSFIIL